MNCLKHTPLQGAHNVRDLGGYPTMDSGVTRWGMIYRSDALNELTENDWDVLRKRNVKTIIDLRSQIEADSAPITLPEGMEYFHFSLMSELDGKLKDVSQKTILQSMKLDYEKTLFGNLSCAVKVLNTILNGIDKGAVMFLCSAGKDRTGIIAALVLYLAFYGRLSWRMEKQYLADTDNLKKEYESLVGRNQEIDDNFIGLYADKAKGILTEKHFLKLTDAMGKGTGNQPKPYAGNSGTYQ